MSPFQELQKWYQSQCHGDWEHTYGVKIDTLDNPGWSVAIDLVDTDLAEQSFTKIERHQSETDWLVCDVQQFRFIGFGGPLQLEEIVTIFLEWAQEGKQ